MPSWQAARYASMLLRSWSVSRALVLPSSARASIRHGADLHERELGRDEETVGDQQEDDGEDRQDHPVSPRAWVAFAQP